MNATKSTKIVLASAVLVVLAFAGFLWMNRTPDPVYQGRHASAWFGDWCGEGSPEMTDPQSVIDAFKNMGPEFVPYFAKQLRYDRSGIRERVQAALRNFPATSKYFAHYVPPATKRATAAFALELMGPRADAAIPDLLETWATDRPDIKRLAMDTLNSIMPYTPSDERELESRTRWLTPTGTSLQKRREDAILLEALKRCPNATAELKMAITNGVLRNEFHIESLRGRP